MNQLIILALISALQKEVNLLERELALQQTVATSTYIPPIVIQNPVYVPPPINPPSVVLPMENQILGASASSGTEQVATSTPPVQVGWACVDPHDFVMFAHNLNFICEPGTAQKALFQYQDGTVKY